MECGASVTNNTNMQLHLQTLKQSSFDVHFAVEKSDIWKLLTGDLDDSMTITKFISHEILAFVLCFK